MNYADSEKINMILLQSGFQKTLSPTEADVVILNTCSVREKGEDRVFGFAEEIFRFCKRSKKSILVGLTGCMARKTGLHKRYFESEHKRKSAQSITLLSDENSIFNSDDPIFLRSQRFDFVFRAEEVGYVSKLLSVIWKKEIGNDTKYHDFLQAHQYRENPGSGNVIIQTGCDNFCTYCIVPFTR